MTDLASASPAPDHWKHHADAWTHFGPPLRPCESDVAWMEDALARLPVVQGRSLLMGVTPELAHMRWPQATRVLAVDRCADMIRRLWTPAPPANAEVHCGDWHELPLADGAVDAVVGDGVLVPFSYPQGVARLAAELRRVLRPEGRWLMRAFVRPEQSESPSTVLHDLVGGRIGNFHAYKWRLMMALQPSLALGVRPRDVWSLHQLLGPASKTLSERVGWPQAQIETLDSYRDSQSIYFFPTLEELRQTLAPHFEVVEQLLPDYELGDRCALLALRPLPR